MTKNVLMCCCLPNNTCIQGDPPKMPSTIMLITSTYVQRFTSYLVHKLKAFLGDNPVDVKLKASKLTL